MAALKLPKLDFEMVEWAIREVTFGRDPAQTSGFVPARAGRGNLTWDSRETWRGEKSPAVLPAGRRPDGRGA